MSEDFPTPPAGSGPAPTPGGFVAPAVEDLQAQLPGYDILELIAAGGMGAVYKARQPKLARTVAIKVLPSGADADGSMNYAERFHREAQAMAKLHHSRIVGVHDFGQTKDGHSYIVMEFVEGTDLHELIRGGTLTQSQVLAIITQICDALNYAHERGIVHRDIKPANIMLDVDGQVKVADFGLAKLTGSDAAVQSQLTLTNMAMGTPDYVAPEQLEIGAEVDGRADIYALGVMIYEMLTGKVPRGMFRPPSQAKEGVDLRMDAVVARAMQSDQELRYPSVTELWREVEEIISAPAAVLLSPSRSAGQPKLEATGRLAIKPGDGKTRRVAVKPATALGAKRGGLPPSAIAAMVAGAVLVIGVIAALVLSGGGKGTTGETADGRGGETAKQAAPKARPASEPGRKASSEAEEEQQPSPEPVVAAVVVEGPATLDLLQYVKAEEDALNGEWGDGPNGGLVGMGEENGANVALPVVLEAKGEVLRDYELAMTLRRKGAFESFRVILPLPEGAVAVVLDRVMRNGAIVTALGKVAGIDSGAKHNPTRVEGRQLPPEKEVNVRVVVRAAEGGDVGIRLLKGGKPLLEWAGPASALEYEERSQAVTDALAARRPVFFVGKGGAIAVVTAELKFARGAVTVLRPALSLPVAAEATKAEPAVDSEPAQDVGMARAIEAGERVDVLAMEVIEGTAGLLRNAEGEVLNAESESGKPRMDTNGPESGGPVKPAMDAAVASVPESKVTSEMPVVEVEDDLPEVAELRECVEKYEAAIEERFAGLRKLYAGAVRRELDAAAKAADLDGAAVLKGELERMEKGEPLPAEDAEDLPVRFAGLRETLRAERGKVREELTGELETSLKALEVELTKAKRIEDAIAVKAYREGFRDSPAFKVQGSTLKIGNGDAALAERAEAEAAGIGIGEAGIRNTEVGAHQGALYAWGVCTGGKPVNLGKAKGIGNFVRVQVNPDGIWAALRANGMLVSNAPEADGIAGVIDFDVASGAGLILKADGEVIAYGAAKQNIPKGLRGIVDVGWALSYGFAVRTDGKVEAWTNTDETPKERAARMLSQELENVAAVACHVRAAVFRLKDGTVRVFGHNGPEEPLFRTAFEEITDVREAVIGKGGRVTVLTGEGEVIYRGNATDQKSLLPPALRAQRFTAIREGTSVQAARRPDGTWEAWGYAGELEGVVEKIRSLGAVADVAVGTPLDPKGPVDGVVMWID